MVNQTDQIQLVGHRRELATDGLPSQEETTVVHDRNFAIEATRCTMDSQRTANSVLTEYGKPLVRPVRLEKV